MLDGVMLLWFILTALSVVYVALDIISTPEAKVMKWGFVILTCFSGPLGAFFYVLGCREPLPGTHEAYVSARWRQVLGSTMHCAAGDGLGIMAGAAIGSVLALRTPADIGLEYVIGFGFGWLFFQAFAMRDMAGGDYLKSLRMTFIPEFLSMNVLMAGMVLVSRFWMPRVEGASHPSQPAFWFIMSMALVAGFMCAYPMNWWLVGRKLKHGMMTVRSRPPGDAAEHDMTAMKHDMSTMGHDKPPEEHDMSAMNDDMPSEEHDLSSMNHGGSGHDLSAHATGTSRASILLAGVISVLILAAAIGAALRLGPASP